MCLANLNTVMTNPGSNFVEKQIAALEQAEEIVTALVSKSVEAFKKETGDLRNNSSHQSPITHESFNL